jgi:hypothetical protein
MLHPIAEAERRVTAAACGLGASGDMACAAAPRNNLKSQEYLQADRLAAVVVAGSGASCCGRGVAAFARVAVLILKQAFVILCEGSGRVD